MTAPSVSGGLKARPSLIIFFFAQFPEMRCLFWARRSLLGPDGTPCVVLWRPEALDSSVLNPPEAWSGLTRNPPSLRFEPRTSCIRGPMLSN